MCSAANVSLLWWQISSWISLKEILNRRKQKCRVVILSEVTKAGQALRDAIDACGWCQVDVARKLGISPQNLTQWLRKGIPLKSVRRAAGVLGVPADQLAPEDGDLLVPEPPHTIRTPFSVDPEVVAIRGIVTLLSRLDAEAQQRVVAWVKARYCKGD